MGLPKLPKLTLKRSVPFLAALILFSLTFQVTALDHQLHVHDTDIADVVGVQGTSAHRAHCHGTSTCAGGASGQLALTTPLITLPSPPAARLIEAFAAADGFSEPFLGLPIDPPRI